MIDLEFVESLIRALDESSLDSLELERGGTRIRLSKSPAPCGPGEAALAPANPPAAVPVANSMAAPPAAPPDSAPTAATEPVEPQEAPEGSYVEITSPMVGTFYRAPAPEASPYVNVGSRIEEGSVLCIIEAMKLMNELEADMSGTIVKIMVENAEPVEFGQVLFLVDPS